MFSALAQTAARLLRDLNRSRLRKFPPEVDGWSLARKGPAQYLPLTRVTITDGVSRTLFEEYAEHRAGPRGHEETGWLILGLREIDEAVVLATLPAGAGADASG